MKYEHVFSKGFVAADIVQIPGDEYLAKRVFCTTEEYTKKYNNEIRIRKDVAETLCEGDIIITKIYMTDQLLSNPNYPVIRIVDGKVQLNGYPYDYLGYNYSLDRFAIRHIGGYDVLDEELYNRIPEIRFGEGTTLEEIIEICEFFDEVNETVPYYWTPRGYVLDIEGYYDHFHHERGSRD